MESVTFVLFGATGDLAKTRLMPAFSRLISEKKVGSDSVIIAIGRREFDDKTYRESLHAKVPEGVKVHYFKADIEESDDLKGLGAFFEKIKAPANHLYYLSIGYQLFPAVVSQLKKHKLHKNVHGFTRVVFEKPFGGDLASAQAMDKDIHEVFDESDIFRIDHYLGKETVENLLAFRFSNPLFERIWNNEFIDRIFIRSDETDGVGHRVGYYDTAGALRDMVQNHLLQLLSFILMDAPKSLDADDISAQKVAAIESIKLRGIEDVIVGQYEGYTEEVKKTSTTETFVALRLHSSLPRWKDVPIVIRTGKKLPKKEAEIVLEMKKEPCLHYCRIDTTPNRLIIRIQPEQDILLSMNVRNSRTGEIEESSMTFSHSGHFKSNSPEAYEKLLLQCIIGDKTLFPRFDELQEAWKIIEKIEALKPRTRLVKYSKEKPESVLNAFTSKKGK